MNVRRTQDWLLLNMFLRFSGLKNKITLSEVE